MEEPTTTPDNPPVIKEFPLYVKVLIMVAKLLGYFLAFIIFSSSLGGVMSMLAPNLNPEDLQTGSIQNWRSMSYVFLGTAIGAIAVSLLFRRAVDRQEVWTLGISPENIPFKIAKGAVWAITLLSIAFLILWVTGLIKVSKGEFEVIDLVGFLGLFLLVSIQEELVFRGYITSLLAKDLHFFPTLLISSAIFAGVHIGNTDFTWMGFASIFLGGYLLGILFLKYQDLYIPIGMHWLWNYYHGNVLGFDVSGYAVPGLLDIEMVGADWLTGGEFGLEGSIITAALLLIVSIALTFRWSDDLQPVEAISVA